MATLNDRVFDNGLTILDTEANKIVITSQEATIIDTVNSRLLATSTLTASQAVTSGNTFTLSSVSIGIPDPA